MGPGILGNADALRAGLGGLAGPCVVQSALLSAKQKKLSFLQSIDDILDGIFDEKRSFVIYK